MSFLDEPGPVKKTPKSPTLGFFSKLTKSPKLGGKKKSDIKKVEKKKNEDGTTIGAIRNAIDASDLHDVNCVTDTLYTERGIDSDNASDEDEDDIRGVKTDSGDFDESFYDHPDILKFLESPYETVNTLSSVDSPNLTKFHQLDTTNKGVNVNYDSNKVEITPVVVKDSEEINYIRKIEDIKKSSTSSSIDENTIVIEI